MRTVAEAMTTGVRSLAPTETVIRAAQAMEALDVGIVPICDGETLLGVVTDRDIVVRGVAQGLSADRTPLRDVMTDEACWCYDDQSLDEALGLMREAQIRRLPVVDRDKRLVGMLSLGDVAVRGEPADAAAALNDISEPAMPDRSGQSQASGAAGGGAQPPRRR